MLNFHKISLMFLCVFILLACQRQPTSTADIPRLLPASYKISVAPFMQPLHPGQLISGQIPEFQGKISENDLLDLDLKLRDALVSQTNRQYNFLPASALPQNWQVSTGQPSALDKWISYGKAHNVQYLLVPQVLDWHEREGSQAGVTNSASVRIEFYLLNINQAILVARSVFEEKQVGLIDNLFTISDFVKRKGQWVTAGELASEGMRMAIRDLGL